MALPQLYPSPALPTEADYFAFEQSAVGRWEYVNGEIRAMAGGTEAHNIVVGNVFAALRLALIPKGCRAYVADMKVHTSDGVNTFPDVAVVCGERQYHEGRQDVIVNPVLLVEVLSPSTEEYDRGEKFAHYQTIPTLMYYVLVEPGEPRVMLHARTDTGWQSANLTDVTASVDLPVLGIQIALADIYALMPFGAN